MRLVNSRNTFQTGVVPVFTLDGFKRQLDAKLPKTLTFSLDSHARSIIRLFCYAMFLLFYIGMCIFIWVVDNQSEYRDPTIWSGHTVKDEKRGEQPSG